MDANHTMTRLVRADHRTAQRRATAVSSAKHQTRSHQPLPHQSYLMEKIITTY